MKLRNKGSEDLQKMRDPDSDKAFIKTSRRVAGGYVIHGPFYIGISKGVRQMIPFLEYGYTYSPAQLLGFWSELNSAEARIAELVIAHQVQHGELALIAAKRGANGFATYMRA